MGGAQSNDSARDGPLDIGTTLAKCRFDKIERLRQMEDVVTESYDSSTAQIARQALHALEGCASLLVALNIRTTASPAALMSRERLLQDTKVVDWAGSTQLAELFNDTYDLDTDRFSKKSARAKTRFKNAITQVQAVLNPGAHTLPDSFLDIELPSTLEGRKPHRNDHMGRYAYHMANMSIEKNKALKNVREVLLMCFTPRPAGRFRVLEVTDSKKLDDLLQEIELQRATVLKRMCDARKALEDVIVNELAASAACRTDTLTENIVDRITGDS